uniref:Uncharacterized protein n=1 Tax=Arundo donax TaxID=35708 RepID=A0A0A9H3Q2_ARUDO
MSGNLLRPVLRAVTQQLQVHNCRDYNKSFFLTTRLQHDRNSK